MGLSDKGTVRPINEDCFAIDEGLGFCAIADGVGGYNAGEIAAHTAIDAILDVARARPRADWPFGFDSSLSEAANLIRTAIHLANKRVLETGGNSSVYTGMGTTIVAALVTDTSRSAMSATAGCTASPAGACASSQATTHGWRR